MTPFLSQRRTRHRTRSQRNQRPEVHLPADQPTMPMWFGATVREPRIADVAFARIRSVYDSLVPPARIPLGQRDQTPPLPMPSTSSIGTPEPAQVREVPRCLHV
jgi:hypothetical protein